MTKAYYLRMARDKDTLNKYFQHLDAGFVEWDDLTHVKELGEGQFAQVRGVSRAYRSP
mgnify:CR=1 FL=1